MVPVRKLLLPEPTITSPLTLLPPQSGCPISFLVAQMAHIGLVELKLRVCTLEQGKLEMEGGGGNGGFTIFH